MTRAVSDGRPRPELLVDSACLLGEGPVWDGDAGLLRWVDIEGCRVWSHDPRTRQTESVEVAQPVTALVSTTAGGYVATTRDGVAGFDPSSGALDPLVSFPSGEARRANDAKCDPQGRFWIGVMHESMTPGLGSLYCLETDGELRPVLERLTLPNGLDWSPDRRTMYFVDTLTHGVDAYPFDPTTGELGSGSRLVDVPEDEGLADGLTVDAEGCIWVAFCFGSAVRRYSPTGELLTSCDLPVSMPTSCCFGGEDMGTLFITTATTGLTPEQLSEQPGAGGVFGVRPGVTGVPAARLAVAEGGEG